MQAPEQGKPHLFYTVSMGKLSLLYFATSGLYTYFWMYRLWKDVQIQTGRDVFPIIRAILDVFFVHQLFGYIKQKESKSEFNRDWNALGLAFFYIGIHAVMGIYLIFLDRHLPYVAGFIFGLLLFFLQFYVLYQVQLAVNRAAGDPYGHTNNQLTLENHLWMIFGAIIWVNRILLVLNPPVEVADPRDPPAIEQKKDQNII